MAERPPKFLANGQPDGRGRSEGSKVGQFVGGDGRPRPGRKKGARDERTLVRDLLKKKVPVGKDGKRISIREGILLAHAKKALSGDPKSTDYLQKMFDRHELPPVEPHRTQALLAEDQAILEMLQKRGMLPAPFTPGTEEGAQ